MNSLNVLKKIGRGEWIRTTDLLVPNQLPTYSQRLSDVAQPKRGFRYQRHRRPSAGSAEEPGTSRATSAHVATVTPAAKRHELKSGPKLMSPPRT